MKPKKVYQYDKKEGSLVRAWNSISQAAKNFDVDESNIRKAAARGGTTLGYYWGYEKLENFFETDFDALLAEKNNRLEKSLIKTRDDSRINRKKRRDHFRQINMLEGFGQAIIDQLEDVSFGEPIQTVMSPKKGKVVIAQLSDPHFNELIDLPHNYYDFYVASKRLRKFAEKIKQEAAGAEEIVVAMTGDMLNSDRRLDEKLSQATNRMKAALLATSLISYFIQDLSTVCPVEVVSVTGNESRVHEEWGLSDQLLTDNYDYLIFNLLKPLFVRNHKVTFVESNPYETVINVYGRNILLTHGTMYKQATQERIQKTLGRYSSQGTQLDYVIFGHIHFANIGDIFARSGSLSGSNTYSEYGLDLVTKASQNIHIVYENGDIDNKRVELHNTDDVEGYPIKDDIEAYNAIGSRKAYSKYTVIEINK
jgi:predicted phosphodiesterase